MPLIIDFEDNFYQTKDNGEFSAFTLGHDINANDIKAERRINKIISRKEIDKMLCGENGPPKLMYGTYIKEFI